MDQDKLAEQVNTILPYQVVSAIKAGYPQEHWLIEFEANVVERVFTAEELADVFIEACTLR